MIRRPPLANVSVRINPPIAQKRPVATHAFDLREVDLDREHFSVFSSRADQHARAWFNDEGIVHISQPDPLRNKGLNEIDFDDVMKGKDGFLWIIEYKGGSAELSWTKGRPQMSEEWVNDVIKRMEEFCRKEYGRGVKWPQLDKIKIALKKGELQGICIKTPWADGSVNSFGASFELKRWKYTGQ